MHLNVTQRQKWSAVTPVGAESFVVVVHLQPDGSAQGPVDVQQPLQDELSVFLHTQTHRADGQDQSSCSEDILLAACHSGSVSGVRADRGARRFHRADAFIMEKPLQFWPSLYFTGAGLEADKEACRRIGASCFRSRRLVCGVLRSLTADKNVKDITPNVLKRKTFKQSIFQLFRGFNSQNSLAETLSAEFSQLPSWCFLAKTEY